MGRLSKKGVDFFSHDTDASTRETVRTLQRKYGNNGYAAWFKLLENLGRTETLSLDCSNRETVLNLSENFLLTEQETMEILDFMACIDAIDYNLWKEKKVVWIQNFVERLSEVFRKRKKPAPKRPGAAELEQRRNHERQEENGQPVEADQTKDHIDQAQGTGEQPSAADGYPFGLTDDEIRKSLDQDAAIEDAARSYGLPCHEGNMLTARDLAREYSLEWLIAAIKRSGEGKSQTWGYVRGILQSWKDQGHMDMPGGKRKQTEPDQNAMNKWGGTL